MKQIRQNVRSTSKTKKNEELNQIVMTSQESERQNLISFKVIELEGKIYTDQTGRFPTTSSLGNKYVLVLFDADTNSILAEPLKSRAQEELLGKQVKLHKYLTNRGYKPMTQVLDNECPDRLIQFFKQSNTHFQLVPPHLHRTNNAERAIATFKDHLISGLAATDPSFPLPLWDRLIPQAVLTLNLLRPARFNPRLSAWAALNGTFDFNATPLAPPGTKVLIYDPPETRKTWAPHCTEGWYIGPSLNHYRCYRCYATKTRSERTARTVQFLPTTFTMPKISSADAATDAALKLAESLKKPHPASPLLPPKLQQIEALEQLAKIFCCAINLDKEEEPRVRRVIGTNDNDAIDKNKAQNRLLGTPKSQETGAPRGGVGLSPVRGVPDYVPTAPVFPTRTSRTVSPTQPHVHTIPLSQPETTHRNAPRGVSFPTPVATPIEVNQNDINEEAIELTRPNASIPPSSPYLIPDEGCDAAAELLPDRPCRRPPTRVPVDDDDIIYPIFPHDQPLHDNTLEDQRKHPYNLRSSVRKSKDTRVRHECSAVMSCDTGDILHYRQLIRSVDAAIWKKACANDFGRLAQGVGTRMPTGTNTIFFIPKDKVPRDRKISYVNPVASIRPHKEEMYRVRLTAGGDRLEYPGVTSTETVSLITTKIHLNSVISTPGAKYLTADIKDYYYGTPLSRYEYLRIALKDIPDEIVHQYELQKIAHDGYVYIEVRKGMPGLKQAGKIANDRLKSHLEKYGYVPTDRTPALWVSKTNNVSFTLCVDDFGIKYTKKSDAEHLLQALRKLYVISVDWTGSKYLGLTLDWNYDKRTVKLSMPKYIENVLLRFKHKAPTRRQNSPHAWIPPSYGKNEQLVEQEEESPVLPPSQKLLVQQVVGSLLYYALAVDCTLLVALGDLAATQNNATKKTMEKLIWLLNYVATNPNATVTYKSSDMCLQVHCTKIQK
jgi:hypothetical protein